MSDTLDLAAGTSTIIANPEAEQAVLGSILIDPGALLEVQDVLAEADFYQERHGMIYAAMLACLRADAGVDLVTVCDALERAGNLSLVGGGSYVASLVLSTPTAVNAAAYAEIVQDRASRRRAVAELNRLAGLVFDTDRPLADVQAAFQRAADDAFVGRVAQADATLLWERTFDTWAEWQLERVAVRDNPKIDLPWAGFGPRGAVTVRPLRPGTLAVVAAPPGIGKTAFAECCAEHWCRNGFQVAFFHYELSAQSLLDRRMARWSGEDMATIESGELTQRMDVADQVMREWSGRIHYTYTEGWPMVRLAARARQMVRRQLAHVIIVDYLQKAPMREYVRGMTTAQMIGQDVEILKALAEREGVPVLLLSQLSRAGELLGTGDIERKANLVINLERKKLETDMTFGGRIVPAGRLSPQAVAHVEKQTFGETGDAKLMFNGPRFLFADLAK